MIAAAAILTAASALSGCRPVTSDRITGADLARAVPELSALPAHATLSLAPQPGSYRRFRREELQRIAERYGLAAALPESVCFGWRLMSIARSDAERVMGAAWEGAKVTVRISELQPALAPEGVLVFPRSGYTPAPSGADVPGLWRGYVLYGGAKRFSVYARVAIKIAVRAVVAAQPLKPGQALGAAMLRISEVDGVNARMQPARELGEVTGRTLRRSIPAGAPIFTADLEEPFDVVRDQPVRVEVRAGAARLMLDAKAERSGRTGEIIPLLNPVSGRKFLARVEGKDRALVMQGGAR